MVHGKPVCGHFPVQVPIALGRCLKLSAEGLGAAGSNEVFDSLIGEVAAPTPLHQAVKGADRLIR